MRRIPILILAAVALVAPARAGELVAGIELGGKGVKGTVIEYDPSKPGDVTVKDTATINTALADLQDGKFKPENIAKSADAVRELVKRFGDKHGIPAGKCVVAGSSGIVAANRDELSDAVKAVTGKPLPFITAEEEVGLTIQGLGLRKLPTPANLDIGGGNTKGGYYAGEDGKTLVSFAGIPGTVALSTKAKAQGGDYREALKNLANELVTEKLKAVAARDTAWKDQKTVYLTGGSVWAAATLVHPSKVRDPLVTLTQSDAASFLATVALHAAPEPAFSAIADPAARAEAEAEWKKVTAVYSPEHLLAGAHILLRLFEGLPLEGKTVAFARSGGTAWILAYALAESGSAAPAAPTVFVPPLPPVPPTYLAPLPHSLVVPHAFAPPAAVFFVPAPCCPPPPGPRVRLGLLQRLKGYR